MHARTQAGAAAMTAHLEKGWLWIKVRASKWVISATGTSSSSASSSSCAWWHACKCSGSLWSCTERSGRCAGGFYCYISMTAAHSARVIDVSLKEQFTQMKSCFSHLSWYVAVQIVISSFPVSSVPLLLVRRDGALSLILKSFDWLSDSGYRHKENLQMTTKLTLTSMSKEG